VEQRRLDPRGALRHRAPGAACREPGGGAGGRREADARAIARRAAEGKRVCPAAGVPRHRRRGRRGARHHAGRGVAARQLPSRRGADPRDPRRSAARLLPTATEARRGAPHRLSARVRRRLGLRRAHRQPLRPGDAAPVRARLPARAAARDRRAVGGGDHAAGGACREPAARGDAHPRRARRARGSRRARRAAARRERARRRAGRGGAARARTLAARGRLRRSARAAAARPGPQGHAGAAVARAAPRGAGDERRPGRARRAPAAGRDQRDGAQHHHQHAPDLRPRLGGARGKREPDRRRAAAGEPLRGDGFPDAQPLSQRDRRARARLAADRAGSRAGGARGRRRGSRDSSRRPRAARLCGAGPRASTRGSASAATSRE